jgi:cysteine desulfurase
LVTSAVEHPNVFRALESLAPLGFTCTRVAVDAMGRVDPEAVRTALTEQTVLLAVHQANHDVGTIQRVLELSRLAADRGITFFVDATSSAGWLPVDVQTSAISLLALAPHRFHGPKGVGALYRNRRTRFARGLPGSPPEEGPGSAKENVPAIVGAGVAAECARREFEPRRSLTRRLQQRLWSELPRRVPYLKRHGPEPGPERLTTSVSFSAEFIDGEAQALVLDTRGIAAASGSSCVAKALRASPVLTALGVDPALAQSNLVLSLGANNTDEEVAYFLETYPAIVEKLRGLSPRWDEFQRGLCDSIINPRLS